MRTSSVFFSLLVVPFATAQSLTTPTTIRVSRTLASTPPVTVVPTTRTKVITEIPTNTAATNELFPLPSCTSMNAISCCSGELFFVPVSLSTELSPGAKVANLHCSGTVFSVDIHTETSVASLKSTSTGAAAALPTAFGRWDVLGLAAGAVAVGAMA